MTKSMCFTNFQHICSRYDFRRNRVWSVPVTLVRCPLLLLFFSRWPTVVAETCQAVVCDCTRDSSFRSIARPPGRYLFHSGSCGHLPHDVCPHATLMTTSTPKTQWTVAYTVAFGRGVTTISTRSACVENENTWSRVLCFWFT